MRCKSLRLESRLTRYFRDSQAGNSVLPRRDNGRKGKKLQAWRIKGCAVKNISGRYRKEIDRRIQGNPEEDRRKQKKIRDELDRLKDEVRRPLTEWEDAETQRVQSLKDRIASIYMHASQTQDSVMVGLAIKNVESVSIDDSWQILRRGSAGKGQGFV